MLATTGLTAKQEAFCQGLINGLSQVDAYIKAGYSQDCERQSLYVNASQLANDAKVVQRLRDLQAINDHKTICGVKERKEILSKIAREEKKDVRARDITTAIHTLNLMDRLYQTNVDTHLSISISYDGSKPLPGATVEGQYTELPASTQPQLDTPASDIT